MPTFDVFTLKNGIPGPEVALELCVALGDSREEKIRVTEETIDLPGIGEQICIHMRVCYDPRQSANLHLSLWSLADVLASLNGEAVYAHFPWNSDGELIQFKSTAGQASS